jgi:hypothetical protein
MWMVGGLSMARAAHVVLDERVVERRRVRRRGSMAGWLVGW